VIRVHGDGSSTLIADLSEFVKAHPVQNPEPDDFEPDGTWYSIVAVGVRSTLLNPTMANRTRSRFHLFDGVFLKTGTPRLLRHTGAPPKSRIGQIDFYDSRSTLRFVLI